MLIKEKILSRSERSSSGCWLWVGTKTTAGYGVIVVNKKREYAHRLSWCTFVGAITKGLMICHKCDTPSCVNPEHLFCGTSKDNMQDMARKGRSRKTGTRKPGLSTDDLTKISNLKNSGLTYKAISLEFGYHWKHISRIHRGLSPVSCK